MPELTTITRNLISTREACALTGLCSATLKKHASRGRLRFHAVNCRVYRWHLADLLALIGEPQQATDQGEQQEGATNAK